MTSDHDAIMDKYMKDLETIAQRSAFYSASRVPPATRKYSGQAQASTKLAIGAPDPRVVLSYDATIPDSVPNPIGQAVERMLKVSTRVKLGDIMYVSNNLPYIGIVNYVYGDLMFEKAARRWQEDVDRAVSDT